MMTPLSVEHVKVIARLLISLIPKLLCLREWEGPKRTETQHKGRDWGMSGEWAIKTHTTSIKFAILHGHASWGPKTITIVISKITDQRSPRQMQLWKVGNIARFTKMWQRHEVSTYCWKKWCQQSCSAQSYYKSSI